MHLDFIKCSITSWEATRTPCFPKYAVDGAVKSALGHIWWTF